MPFIAQSVVGLPSWAHRGEVGPSVFKHEAKGTFLLWEKVSKKALGCMTKPSVICLSPKGAGQLTTAPRAFGAIEDSYLWTEDESSVCKE